MEISKLAWLCNEIHEERLPGHSKEFWSGSINWAVCDGVLVFSGTNAIQDWFVSGNFLPRRSPTGPGWVHGGFLGITLAVWAALKQLTLGGDRISLVTGYSLGGALAMLAGECLKNVEVVTFACPEIGSLAWARRYPHASIHFSRQPDLVTGLLPGYCRPGVEAQQQGLWNFVRNHLGALEGWGAIDHSLFLAR